MPIAGHRIVCPSSQINHLMNANTPKETIINMCVRRSFTAEAVVPALHGYVDPSVPSYSGQGLRAVPSRSLMPQPAPVFRGLRVQ